MILDQIDIIKDLINSIRVMTEIIERHPLTEDESRRLKYVTRTIEQMTEQFSRELSTDRQYFIIYNNNHDDVKGCFKWIADRQIWEAEWYEVPSGRFTVTPIVAKAHIICFSLSPIV